MKNLRSTLKYTPKRIVAFGATVMLATTFILPATAMAATNTTTITKCAPKDLQCVITAGDTLFTDRQDALKKIQAEVSTFQGKKSLTDAQANSIMNNLSTNLNDITSLKATFDAETTASAARKDIRDLYSQYRIFAVVDPRDSREIHLDIESNIHDKLADIEANLEHLIDKAPAADQAQLKDTLADYKAKVADAGEQIADAQQILPDLTVNNFNNNRGIYDASLKKLAASEKQTSQDLHTAATDLHQLRQQLHLDK